MGTSDVIDGVFKFPLLTYLAAVDLIDRLNFIFTVVMLIFASMIVTFREYMMDPITCYMATNPGGENLLKYMESFCWVQGTMSLTRSNIPQNDKWDDFVNSRQVYYQWVPLMYFIQGAMFFLPHALWVVICRHVTGLNISEFMQQAPSFVELETKSSYLEPNSRHSISSETKDNLNNNNDERIKTEVTKWKHSNYTQQLFEMFVQHREWRRGKLHDTKQRIQSRFPIIPSKRLSNWLVFFYFVVKFLYLANAIGQLYLMQYFLQLDQTHNGYSSSFGIELLAHIVSGKSWELTGAFPRVAYCMAKIQHLSDKNIHVAQCVLTANLFIEKIYIFLWFWIVAIIVANLVSILIWIKRLSFRRTEIKKYLRLRSVDTFNDGRDLYPDFCDRFLQLDGVFLLQMMALNIGDITVGSVVTELFKIWRRINNNWTQNNGVTKNSNNNTSNAYLTTHSTSNKKQQYDENNEMFQLVNHL